MDSNPEEESQQQPAGQQNEGRITRLSGMYQNYFLDYASYVILERAVPALLDGYKPVQRRLLHALREMDDGRFHKVANVIGQTMKYHPHGDASIGDALVQIGQKELLLDMQGNWGNIFTGDSAAAPRYIEVKLSKFALEVVFNPKITEWSASYDGRSREPVVFPVKFPMVLAMGVEGIAVGLSTKILPHNFNELIDGSIQILKGKKVEIFPDFPTGGIADFSNYNDGLRGGRVRVRAKIAQQDKKTLVITEIPFGTTTSSLIDSILKANDKGKIKIKKIDDNTAEFVEILIHLAPGISPDKTIDALYAFTDCEVSVSPLCCVIHEDRPMFVGVSELLKASTENTLKLLKADLEIKLNEFQEQWHFASLERIFIENRIYRDIEEAATWEEVMANIHAGLKPHTKHLLREVTDEDVVRLTEIRIKRISKFDSQKALDHIAALEGEIEQVKHHLDNLVTYAIDYFKNLKKKYGEGRERKTEIRLFEDIEAAKVAIANEKLYVNRIEGFIGTGLKKDEFVGDCSDIDDIIVFRADGIMSVHKVDSKIYVGKDIIHVAVFKKADKRTIYNMVYQDGPRGNSYMKRFAVTSITRDREYDLTAGTKGSKVLYFTANPNGEAEVVNVFLRPLPKLRKLRFELDFAELVIKGRNSKGNLVSKYPVKKIEIKEKGVSTLAPRKVWFDESVKRLNYDGRGILLGRFAGEDKILTIMASGHYRLYNFDLANHFDADLLIIQKFNPEQPVSVVYFEGKKGKFMVKRFLIEPSDKKEIFISEEEKSYLKVVSVKNQPTIQVIFKDKNREEDLVNLEDFIAVKGIKAMGNQLTPHEVKNILVASEQEPEEDVAEVPDEPPAVTPKEIPNPIVEEDGQLRLLDFD
jgi:topoisomerase IV subunit A